MVRETLWASVGGTFTVLSAPGSRALINVTGTALLDIRPWTVVRIRGHWFIDSDQAAAAEDQAASLGACVVSDQAVAIGPTAIPTPVADRGSDLFMVYESLMASRGAGTVDSQTGIGSNYDSRAMRKVEEGAQLVWVIETDVAALTSGVALRHNARVLIKLH